MITRTLTQPPVARDITSQLSRDARDHSRIKQHEQKSWRKQKATVAVSTRTNNLCFWFRCVEKDDGSGERHEVRMASQACVVHAKFSRSIRHEVLQATWQSYVHTLCRTYVRISKNITTKIARLQHSEKLIGNLAVSGKSRFLTVPRTRTDTREVGSISH